MANCRQCGRKLPGFSFGSGECKWCKQYAAAQRGEVPEDARQEVMPTPWERQSHSGILVTQAIVGICGAVFIGMVASGASLTDPTSQDLIRWGANARQLTLQGEWWRLLTSVFVHIGIIHIALNMWCLWSLGEMAEPMYGRGTFATIYLLCGLAASLTSALVHPYGVSAGASGAIFGIAGALIASFKLGEFSMPRAAVQASLKSVLTFAGYNLVFGFLWGRIDNSAHLGGLVLGLLLGALLAKLAPTRDEAGMRVVVLGLVALLLVGGIGWYQYSHRYMAHVNRANELIQQRKLDEGIAELETALRLNPNYAPARMQLAYAVLAKGDNQRAALELQKAVDANPKDPHMHYLLGTMYQNQKEFDKAKGAYLKAASLAPQMVEPHFGLGYLAWVSGDYEQAVREYRRVLEIAPDTEGANNNLGLALGNLGRYDEAIAAFKNEIQLSGDSAHVQSALADVYTAKGMTKEANEAKQAAEKLRQSQGGPPPD